jgi:hypothetical protein
VTFLLGHWMPTLEAEERLKAGPVGDAELFDLILAATGSEDAALDAVSERLMERLRNGEKPGFDRRTLERLGGTGANGAP